MPRAKYASRLFLHHRVEGDPQGGRFDSAAEHAENSSSRNNNGIGVHGGTNGPTYMVQRRIVRIGVGEAVTGNGSAQKSMIAILALLSTTGLPRG